MVIKVKEHEKLTGRLNSSMFTLSADKKLSEPIIDRFGGGTEALNFYFILKLNLEDKWDLENFIKNKLLEESRLRKRDNLTADFEKVMSRYLVEYYEEKLKNNTFTEPQKKIIRDWIKDIKEVKTKHESN